MVSVYRAFPCMQFRHDIEESQQEKQCTAYSAWPQCNALACAIQGVPKKSTLYRNYPIVIIWMPEHYAEHKSA
jgi:hypothetical protein